MKIFSFDEFKNNALNESYGSGATNDLENGYDLYIYDPSGMSNMGHMTVPTFFHEYKHDLTDTNNVGGYYILKNIEEGRETYTFIVSLKEPITCAFDFDRSVDFALTNLNDTPEFGNAIEIEKFINKYCIAWLEPDDFEDRWLSYFAETSIDDIAYWW